MRFFLPHETTKFPLDQLEKLGKIVPLLRLAQTNPLSDRLESSIDGALDIADFDPDNDELVMVGMSVIMSATLLRIVLRFGYCNCQVFDAKLQQYRPKRFDNKLV